MFADGYRIIFEDPDLPGDDDASLKYYMFAVLSLTDNLWGMQQEVSARLTELDPRGLTSPVDEEKVGYDRCADLYVLWFVQSLSGNLDDLGERILRGVTARCRGTGWLVVKPHQLLSRCPDLFWSVINNLPASEGYGDPCNRGDGIVGQQLRRAECEAPLDLPDLHVTCPEGFFLSDDSSFSVEWLIDAQRE
jgi:hypothetical protein